MRPLNFARLRVSMSAAAAILMIFVGNSTCKAQALLTQKELSVEAALSVANGALNKCHTDGYRVSLTVLDASGLIKVQVRGDGTGPHTLEHSHRKAYTALTFKRASAETAKAWALAPTHPVIEGTVGAAGGVPIKAGNEVIGAIGVSGAPGGEKDEACAAAGIATIVDLLK